jgi:hypothetical protein
MGQRVSYPEFIGAYVTRTEKALLALLAAQKDTTVSAVIREFIAREATKPLVHHDEVVDVQHSPADRATPQTGEV